ncbi:MAG: HAMP domain-containing histidine kinase [Bryobacterales bacterium]|nr:HAMP domain-containing histidine kinase [Bryobacterales bacterium]
MRVVRNRRRAVLSWLFIGLVVGLSLTLGVLQYRWIGEVSRADAERMRVSLQSALHRVSIDFNSELTAACAALLPDPYVHENPGDEKAYELRYAKWRDSGRYKGFFRRIALAAPRNGNLTFRLLDLDKGTFQDAPWPDAWQSTQTRLEARISAEPFSRPRPPGQFVEDPLVLDIPRFVFPDGPGPGFGERFRERRELRAPSAGPANRDPRRRLEMEWLLVELDPEYLGSMVVPELFKRSLGARGELDYDIEIVARNDPSQVLYPKDSARISSFADASGSLVDVSYEQLMRRGPWFRPGGGERMRAMAPGRGRWSLLVRNRAGSLGAVVERARLRNLAVTTAILLLMLAAIAMLVHTTRKAQRLAELQMEFVAGVSHELRTPLTVIRTAGHNLSAGLIHGASQIARYGALIEAESEKLRGIVEQVLRFSNAEAGRIVQTHELVSAGALIEDALRACRSVIRESECQIERKVDPDLPAILGDPTALQHALQNLLNNAAKYGRDGRWIGLTAASSTHHGKPVVEIHVADRGPGIPPNEWNSIFDPFYRGRRAVDDQIHGTGLGLSLVKRIVEAHGGVVSVTSQPGILTEFVIRIPASMESMNEFADSVNRG